MARLTGQPQAAALSPFSSPSHSDDAPHTPLHQPTDAADMQLPPRASSSDYEGFRDNPAYEQATQSQDTWTSPIQSHLEATFPTLTPDFPSHPPELPTSGHSILDTAEPPQLQRSVFEFHSPPGASRGDVGRLQLQSDPVAASLSPADAGQQLVRQAEPAEAPEPPEAACSPSQSRGCADELGQILRHAQEQEGSCSPPHRKLRTQLQRLHADRTRLRGTLHVMAIPSSIDLMK